jgi:hypothetical protein
MPTPRQCPRVRPPETMLAGIRHITRLAQAVGRSRAVRVALAAGFAPCVVLVSASYADPPRYTNISPPTITGTAQQGQTLTEVRGSWRREPTGFTYKWLRCNSSGAKCSPVSKATAQTYVPVAEDVGHKLRVQETPSNAGSFGSSAESAATGVVVPPAPELIALPTVTGTAQQGQTLTEVHGSWMYGPAGYAYQWLRCNSAGAGCGSVAGATAETYVPVAEDVGHTLRVKEAASNAYGSASPAESAATGVVVPPTPTLMPLVPTPLVISITSVTVNRHGVALIPLRCPATAAGGCHGTITIAIRAETRTRRARAARCARGCRRLGTANYEARAGQKIRLGVHLSSYGRRLLTRHKTLQVTLTATSVYGEQRATVVRTITLRRPRYRARVSRLWPPSVIG